MIELRWTWNHQSTGILASEVKAGEKPTLYPVLQFRYRSWVPGRLDDDEFDLVFSEWQDIPLPPKPED